ncbi:hypothetical protein D8Y22_12270 [Salinadaptatus halalkaliphilus]|uniref:Uncharacterized protein n=1 Tax=Salinadaptatus halalkaliphilus TaxID=2419781 RepID=A0A4S3TKN9_9EURY|nr:hypothetical protein [Salinadaptatus halalkaliphilus]THE64596.1 hypothetical protein D8Y22_12270 [Salinadaptatus halalkaliphilus]
MERRQLLATGGTLAAAAAGGCVGCATAPTLYLAMEATSDRDIGERMTMALEPDSEDHRIGIDAVESDSVTATDISEPFPLATPYAYEGTVYTADATVVDRTPGTSISFSINPLDDDERVDSADAIEYDELPDVDKDAFDRYGWDEPDPFLGYSTSVHYLEDDLEASVLVPDPEYEVIVWPERRGRFEVDGHTDQPLETYEYTAEAVADSIEQYGREIREPVEFELGPLDEEVAAVVEDAIEDPPYTVPREDDLSDAESQVVEQFEDQERVHVESVPENGSLRGTEWYIVAYADERYWADMRVFTG